jgi:hypothetical protein
MLLTFFDTRGIIHDVVCTNWTDSQPSLLFGNSEKAA